MTDSLVTQCPHCRTSFRVSSSQLGAAHGAVRCGACLHVFNAQQQQLAKSIVQPASLPSATALPPQSVQAGLIHDDMDLDSLNLDGLDLAEELALLEQQDPHLQHVPPAPEAAPPSVEPTADASASAALLEESSKPEATAPSTLAMAEEEEPTDTLFEESIDTAPEHTAAAAQPDTEEQVAEEIELAITDSESRAASTFRRNQNLLELNEEPLQLEWQAPRQPWGRWIGWGLLNLMAAGALLAQYSLYHFEDLARQDRFRPWFAAVCPQLGCTLPSTVDISLIKSSNLVVRSHPDFAGALVVDAIIYNRASFAQPFPLLELRFSDLNNQLLANRRFKPGEYLAGELAGQDEMPPQTPIHISLDILDPGQEAVNYGLTFQSPD